jgi:hypothetical protein
MENPDPSKIKLCQGPASEQSVVHIHEFGPWPGRLGYQASELFLGAPQLLDS